MRTLLRIALLVSCVVAACALTPLPDQSAALFAGEWAGTGEAGSWCYAKLQTDGTGWLLVDGGSGDWLGARLQWSNQRQSLQVEKLTPMAASPQRRIMPLEKVRFASGFNQALAVVWSERSAACQLQRIDAAELKLKRAREALEGLPPVDGAR